jgi:outer membrane translocation and assembly module TamA
LRGFDGRIFALMSRGELLSVALLAAAGGLLICRPVGAQTLRFPKRCRQHRAVKPAPQVFLDKVTFTGESHPPGLSRQGLVLRLRQRALDAGSDWLPGVWSAVRDAWQDQGYFQAVVSVERRVLHTSPTERHVSLRIHVDPGPQYRAYVIHVFNTNPGHPLAFSKQKLRDLIPVRTGEILSAAKVRQGIHALEMLYASKGYSDFTVTPGFQVDSKRDHINLNFFLDQGRQYRVGKLQILGLDPDLKPMLQSKLKPGKIFDWSSVLDFYKTQKESLLPGVSPADDVIDRNRKKGTVNVILDFRACPQGETRSSAAGF